jgi:hypothetical protein
MPKLTFTPLMAFVLTMLFSITAGFLYANYGWHNGFLFMLVVVIISFLSYTLREYRGTEAVTRLMPMVMNILVIAVVSVLCAFAGISLGNGAWDATSLLCYFLAVMSFGFAAVCVSVYNAVTADDGGFVGPTLTAIIVLAITFIIGLIVVADDQSNQLLVTLGYVAFGVVMGFLFMWRASRRVAY